MASFNSSNAGWLPFSAVSRQCSDISCTPRNNPRSRTNNSSSSSGGSRRTCSSGSTSRSGSRSRRSSSCSSSSQWPTTFGCSPRYRICGSSSSSCSVDLGNNSSRTLTASRSEGGHVDLDVPCCSSSNARLSVAFCRWRSGGKRCNSSSSLRQEGGKGGTATSLSLSSNRKEMNVTSLYPSFSKSAALAGATCFHVPLLLLALLLLRQSEYVGSLAVTLDDGEAHKGEQLLQLAPPAAIQSESSGVKKASNLGGSPFPALSPLPTWPTSRLSAASDSYLSATAVHSHLRLPDGQLLENAKHHLPLKMQADPTARPAVVAEDNHAEKAGQLATATASGQIAAAAVEDTGKVEGWLQSLSQNDIYQDSRLPYQQAAKTPGVAPPLQDVGINVSGISLPSTAPVIPPSSSTAERRAPAAAEQGDVGRTSAAAAPRAAPSRKGGTTWSRLVSSKVVDDITHLIDEEDESSESSSSDSLPYFQPLLSAIQRCHRCQREIAAIGVTAAPGRPRHGTTGEEAVRKAGDTRQSATRKEENRGGGRPGGRESTADKPAARGSGGKKRMVLLGWNKSRLRSYSWPASTDAKSAGRRGKRGVLWSASPWPLLSTALRALNLSALDVPTAGLALKRWQKTLRSHPEHPSGLRSREPPRIASREQEQQPTRTYREHVADQRHENRTEAGQRSRPHPLPSAHSTFRNTTAADNEGSRKQRNAAQRRSRLQAITATSSKLFAPIELGATGARGTKRRRTTEKSKTTAAVQYYWPRHDSTGSHSSVASSSAWPYTAPRKHSTAVPSHAIHRSSTAHISAASARSADAPGASSTGSTSDGNFPFSSPSTQRHSPLRSSYNSFTSTSPAAWSFAYPEPAAASDPRVAVIYPASLDRMVSAPHLSSVASANTGAAIETGTVADAGPAEASKGKAPGTAAAGDQTNLLLQSLEKRPSPTDSGISDSAVADTSQLPRASSATADVAASLSPMRSYDPASATLYPNAVFLPSGGVISASGAAGKKAAPEEQQVRPQPYVKMPEKHYSPSHALLATKGESNPRSALRGERGSEEEALQELRELITRWQAGRKEQVEGQHSSRAEPLQLAWVVNTQPVYEWQLQQADLPHAQKGEEEYAGDDITENKSLVVEPNRRGTPTAAAPETPLQQQKRRAKVLQMLYMQRREEIDKKRRQASSPKPQPPPFPTRLEEQSTRQRIGEETEKLMLLQQRRWQAPRLEPPLWQEKRVKTADGEEEEQVTGWKQQRRWRTGSSIWNSENLNRAAGAAFVPQRAVKGSSVIRVSPSAGEEGHADDEEKEDGGGEEGSRETPGDEHKRAEGRRAEKAAAQLDSALAVKTAALLRPVDTVDILEVLSIDKPLQPSPEGAVAAYPSSGAAKLPQSSSESASQQQPRQRRDALTKPQCKAEDCAPISAANVSGAQPPAARATGDGPNDPLQQLYQRQGKQETPKEGMEANDSSQQRKGQKRRAPPPPPPGILHWNFQLPPLLSSLPQQHKREQEQQRERQQPMEEEEEQKNQTLQQIQSSTVPRLPVQETPLPQQQEAQPMQQQEQPLLQSQKQLAASPTKSDLRAPQESAQLLQDWQEESAQLAKQHIQKPPADQKAVTPPPKPPRRRQQLRQNMQKNMQQNMQQEELQRFVKIVKVKDWYTETTTASILGRRTSEEDALIVQAPLKNFPNARLKAIFDGHGGPAVSRTCASVAHTFLGEMPELSEKSFCAAALRMDDYLAKHQVAGGSTGLMAVIEKVSNEPKFTVYVANTGDSRGILLRSNKTYAVLSRDHRPHKETEMQRILKAGGYLTKQTDVWRINGRLSVSRAFGDFIFKQNTRLPPEEQIVSAVPEVSSAPANPGDVLLLACDGLFESPQMDWDFVARTAYTYLELFGGDLEHTADGLVNLAYQLGSRDNISVSLTRLLAKPEATPVVKRVGVTAQGYRIHFGGPSQDGDPTSKQSGYFVVEGKPLVTHF